MAKSKKAEEPTLTEEQKIEGALNDQAFNKDEVTLNGKVYKIAHLKYDDFTTFTSYFEPLVRKLLTGINKGEITETTQVDTIALIKTCGDNLPYMGQIILKQTDPDITLDQVKEVCGDPFVICELVLLQMTKNKVVEKFSTFFPQLMSLMRL